MQGARFIYFVKYLHKNLSRVRRLPQGSLFHELVTPCKWQTPFSGWGDASKRIVNKFRRPAILQLNIEGLTASKMSVLCHLAAQREALEILLQETHSTSAKRLVLPDYQLAGFFLSRKHGLATFVHERLKWTLFDQFPAVRRLSGCTSTLMDIRQSIEK